ncbi:uncharacterized protein [Dendropsophus ebraccatus]|uniref:uncharacterized protein n=1 Tax=Dendropsophus ebraccatus TaxID=150705 RepID=UPI0038310A9A
MKITLVFLCLGVCLGLTNAFIAGGRKKMSEQEAYSHGRMMTLVMKRWNDWQSCHRCTEIERYCIEKAIVEDLAFILRLLANDMGCTLQELVGRADFKIQIVYVYNAVEKGDCDTLTRILRSNGLLNHYIQVIVGLLNKPLHDSNVELGGMLKAVNGILGGTLNAALGLAEGVLGGALGILGGAGDAVGGLVGGLTGAAGGVLGGLTGAAGGVLGGLTGAAGGVLGGTLNAATGAVGGALGAATGALGGAVGAVGGLTKGLGGITKGLKLG